MSRFAVAGGAPSGVPVTFDLCQRCSVDPGIVQTAAHKRRGETAESPPVEIHSAAHSSYDFVDRPVPCAFCGRVLGAEDD